MSPTAFVKWPRLTAAEVHVWDLDGAALAVQHGNSRTEHVFQPLDRLAHRHVPQRSNRALRTIAAAYWRCSPDSVEVTRGTFGKPTVSAVDHAGPRLFVSVSRASMHVVAVTQIGPVGVDVEYVGSRAPSLAASLSWCNSLEMAALRAIPEDSRPASTLLAWTGKEAVLKALGTGLAVAPSRVHVTVNDGVCRLISIDGAPVDGWAMLPTPTEADVVGSVAVRCSAGQDVRVVGMNLSGFTNPLSEQLCDGL